MPATMVSGWFLFGVALLWVVKFRPDFAAISSNRIPGNAGEAGLLDGAPF